MHITSQEPTQSHKVGKFRILSRRIYQPNYCRDCCIPIFDWVCHYCGGRNVATLPMLCKGCGGSPAAAQLARLDARLGKGVGAWKERRKLNKFIGE